MTYWEQRGAQLEQLADKRTRITAQKVAHLYDGALERIEQKIQKIYTTLTGNSHITEAEATRLMSVQQTKEARRELETLLERTTDQVLRQELITQLNAPAYGYRIAALEALRDQVYFEAKAIGNDSVAYTESRLKDLYDLGYYRTTFDLSQYEGANVPFSQLSGGRVEAAIDAYWTPDVDTLAGNYSTRIWADTTKLAENVRDIVTRGLMTGGNYADMAAELAAQMGDVQFTKKVEADGSTRTVATGSGAKYRATRLIRTEGNYITGQAKLQSMRDAGYEKYEFVCLLETRTCSVCGGLDGKQFPVAEAQPGVNMNPIHPNCRCFVSPVVSKRLMEAGTRGAQVDASGRKETVPASMTYQEWYEKYVKGTELEKEVAKSSGYGIIKSGGDSVTISSIDSPIEQRNTSRGKPGAILHYDVELNTRQQTLLDSLQEYDSRVTISKTDASMADLAALTAKTGDEFAMFTKSGERLIVRGNNVKVNITREEAQRLAAAGYTWSGHTHPGTGRNCLIASQGDVEILKCFNQLRSCIYNSAGEYLEFWKE